MEIGKINTTYDFENKVASADVLIDNRKFTTYAKCCNEDIDMCSPNTGCEIANKKLAIRIAKEYKRDLKIGLAALEQLYYSMNRSKHFNPKSYENKMLYSQVQVYKNDLAEINKFIAEKEQDLKEYIAEKDKFYKQIRNLRKRKEQSGQI